MEILKLMVFYGGFEGLFSRFKKIPRKLKPWIKDLIEVLTLDNIKINPR